MKQVFEELGKIQYDQVLWLKKLAYASIDIDLFQDRIISLMEEYMDQDEEEKLFELFNEFDRRKEQLDEIKLGIRLHILQNRRMSKSNGDLKKMENFDYDLTKKEMNSFLTELEKLKDDFHLFNTINEV